MERREKKLIVRAGPLPPQSELESGILAAPHINWRERRERGGQRCCCCCCCCCHWCGCRAVTAAVRLTFSGGGGGKQVTTISSPCYQGAMFHRLEQVQARAAVSGEPRRAATPRPPPAAPSPARPKQHTLTFSPVSPTELLHSLAPSTVPHTSGECQVPGFTPTARLLYILIISRLRITLFNLPSKSRRYYIFLCSTICKENTG